MDEQYGTTTVQGADVQLARQSFLTSVFGWMFLGLALTAGIAAYVAASSDMIGWFEDHRGLGWSCSSPSSASSSRSSAGINKLSYSVAVFLFALYAALNGFIFSIILEAYTTASIAAAFGVAAGMFGGMADLRLRHQARPIGHALDPVHGPDRPDHRP